MTVDGLTDGRTDGLTDGPTDRLTDGPNAGTTNGRTVEPDGTTDGLLMDSPAMCMSKTQTLASSTAL